MRAPTAAGATLCGTVVVPSGSVLALGADGSTPPFF